MLVFSIDSFSQNASISINGNQSETVCLNQNIFIRFGFNNGNNGPYTFTYTINGATPAQTITTASGSNIVFLPVNNSISGPFIYLLTGAVDNNNNNVNIGNNNQVTITVNSTPAPTISGNLSICDGATSLLTVTGGSSNFNWVESDNNIATVNNNGLVTGQSPGTVIITYDNNNGCDNSVLFTVKPLPTITPIVSSNGNTTFCQGGNVLLSTSNVSGLSYQWNINGNAIPNATSFNYTAVVSGNYTVTVTNSNGCSSTSQAITVSVLIAIIPDLGGNNNTNIVNFQNTLYIARCTASATGNINISNQTLNQSQVASYTINWGDGNTTNITNFNNQIHNYNQGFYTLNISLTTNQGCIYSKNYEVFVGNTPSGALGNPGNLSGCSPKTIVFPINDTSGNTPGTQYIIDFGDGQSVTYIHPNVPATVSHIYNTSSCGNIPIGSSTTTNSFVASMTTTNPCFPPAFSTIGPIIINTPPTPNFTISPNPGCINTSISLLNTSNPGSIITQSGCNASPSLYWIIQPSTGWIATGLGNNGNNANDIDFWNNGINNPSVNFSIAGTYNITLYIANTCEIKSITKTICVEAPLVPQFTLNPSAGCSPLAVATTNTTSLTNTCPGNPTYLWQVTYAAGYCGTTLATPIPNQTTANASYNFTTPGTYSITLTTTNSCGAVTTLTPQTVIVKKPPTVAINSIPDICLGATITPTVLVNTCSNLAPSAYSWTDTGATPITSNAATPPTFSYANPGTYTISHSVTNECGTTNASQSFVVNPIPIITGPSSVCAGQSITLSANSAGAATNPWVSSDTAIATVSTSGVVTGIAAGAATITFTNSSNCQTTKIITVNPLPTITGTLNVCVGLNTQLTGSATPATTNPWVSSNTSVATISNTGLVTSVTAGTTTITYTNSNGCQITATVIVNAVPAISGTLVICAQGTTQLTGSPTAAATNPWVSSNTAVATISNTGLVTGVTAGTTTITYTNSNGCQITTTVTVNPTPVVSNSTAVICSGSSFTVTPSGASPNVIPSGTTYSWGIPVVTGGMTIGVSGTSQTSISGTLTNPTNLVQTATYTVTPISGAAGNCVGATFTITVIVNPKPFIQDQTVLTCSGTAFTVPLTNAPPALLLPTNTSFTWIVTPPSGISGASNQTSGVSAIDQTLTNSTNAPIDVVYNVTASSGASPNNCTDTFTVTVTVNPIPKISNVTATICSNTSFSVTPTNGGGINSNDIVPTGITYSWPIPVSNPVGAVTGASSGTNLSAPISQNLINSTSSPATLTYTITPKSGSCSGTPFTIVVTVNPSPSVTFSPASQTICSGSTTNLVNLSSTTPGVTFSWTATSNAILPLDISTFTTSGTNTIPVQTLVNSTASAITITYVATASTSVGSTCLGASFPYTITVNPKPAIANITAPAICSGTSFNVTPSSSLPNINPTGTTYSWGAPGVTGGITGGVAAINQASITGTLNNPTNTVQTATYTVTPISNGCSGATFTVVVTVNPTPIIPAQTATICSGDTFTITPTNSGPTVVPSNTTYTWTVSANTDVIGQLASSVAGVSSISQTLTNNSNTVQTVTYTVTPTSGAAGNCPGATFTITVTVNPRPLIPNQTSITCSGIAFTVPLTNAPLSLILPLGTTYSWSAPTVTGGLTGGGAATGQTSISETLINPTNTVQTATYTVTPSTSNCQGASFTVIVTVNPTPKISNVTATICSNTSFSVTPTNGGGINSNDIVPTGTNYSWAAPVVAGIIGAAVGSNQTSITENLTNTTTAPIDVVYSITASSGTAPNNCTSTFNLTVTVNPSPSVTFSPASQTICSGDTTALVTLSSTTPGVTFSWTAANVFGITGIINSSTPGTTTIPVQTLTNTTNAPLNVIYSATATTASGATCLGANSAYTIIVNPKPAIENQTITICNNQSFAINPINGIPISSTIVPVGTLYTWTIIPNPNITGASDGSAASISQTLTNTSNTLQSIVYNVIPSYLNCNGDVFTITVNVNPTPSALFSLQNQTICNNTQSTAINLSSNVITVSINYSWICTNPPLSSDLTGLILSGTTNTIPSQLLVNNTPNPITITYQVTAEIGGINPCLGPPSFITITVNPTFQAFGVISNYNGYGVSVFGGTDGFIDLTVTGGSGIYTYTWGGPNNFDEFTEDLSGLAAGTYTVTINDGYCAPIILTFILTQPPELLVQQDLSLTINATCFGYNNGAVGILITQESVPPYDYELYNSAGVLVASIINSTNLNPQFTGLIAGNYSIKVIDANNGIKTVNALIVTQPDDILITAATTPITCYGANNASITLTVTGGTGPYQAVWDNLATGFYQNNLSAGTYTILVTDSNNCTKPISVFIPEALLFTVNPVVNNISCYGANDGSINLNFVGGIPTINLVWSDGSPAGTTRNNLGPGTYSVTIIDGTPCTIFRTFIIVEPQPLVLSANVTNAFDCTNGSSGAIDLTVSGGNPGYTYLWTPNGAITQDLINITAGNYAVTVVDSKGCRNIAQYPIIRPAPIDITVTTQTIHDCSAHTVVQSFVAQASGGVPGYSYLWSNGQTGPVLNTTINGTYQLTVTDSYGCSDTETVIVDIPILGYVSFNQSSYGFATYGIYSIGDPIQFTNTATGDFVSVLWDFGDGTFSTELNPIHTYTIAKDYIVTLTVTYPFGCVYVQTISLFVEEGYVLVIPTAFTPNNDTLNDTMRPVTKRLTNVQMDIYDTWGSIIYSETGDVLVGWDATIKGFNAENGNYYCKVKGETFYGTTVYSNQTFVLIK